MVQLRYAGPVPCPYGVLAFSSRYVFEPEEGTPFAAYIYLYYSGGKHATLTRCHDTKPLRTKRPHMRGSLLEGKEALPATGLS